MHLLLVFNNRRQHPPILLYNNMYPLKASVAALSLYPNPTFHPRNPLHTNNHKSSSDINHSLAMSRAFLRPSAPSNQKADFSMFEDAKASDARVLVPLREVAEVDMLGVVVAAMDMSANMNARRLLEASLHLVGGVDPEAKEAVETVVLTSNTRIWDQVPVLKRFVFISYFFLELYLTFIYSPFELVPCGISTSTLAMNDSAGSSAKPFSSGPSYSSPGSKPEAERLSSASICSTAMKSGACLRPTMLLLGTISETSQQEPRRSKKVALLGVSKNFALSR
jgi:hypothetical protein